MNPNNDPLASPRHFNHCFERALWALLLLLGISQAWCTPGAVLSWGGGQVSPANPPTTVSAVSVALDHCLVLLSDGTVSAWGYNFDGQCQVPAGLNQVVAVAAGAFFSVALRAGGTMMAWGDNQFNQTQ